jgi:pimeloyl-ACP methyl ester carboxylesterase
MTKLESRATRLTIEGVGLEARWWGPGPEAAPTLVLLHEGLGSVSLWSRFPERLAEATGLGVFAWSRAGYGASDPVRLPRPLTYMHDEALQVLPKLLDAIGFRRGILLGHSDGASIAAIYAGSVEDQRVRGLVLVAPHFYVEPFNVDSIRAARASYEATDLRSRLERHHGANVDCAFHGWAGAWLDPGFVSWDLREYLPHIRLPMLIVQGRDDQYGSLAQVACAEEHCSGPVETALLEACGHSPHREKPEEMLAAVTGFVRRVMAGEAR